MRYRTSLGRYSVQNSLVALGLGCVLSVPSTASAVDKHWNIAGGNWNVGGNWSPVGVPGAGDAVFIGSTVNAENAFVLLNANATVGALSITDGMVLSTESSQGVVLGSTTVSGRNLSGQTTWPSRIQVRQGAAALDFITTNLTVSDEGGIEIREGGTLRVSNLFQLDSGTYLSGEGVLSLTGNGAVSFQVNGNLGAGTGDLTINQLGTGRIDLDGDAQGDNTLNITTGMIDGSDFAELTINGDELTDPMNDDIWIAENNALNMNLSGGWQIGANATLRFSNNSSHPGQARVNGDALDMYGSMEFSGTGAHGQINAPLTLQPTVLATLGPSDLLECNGTTVIEGGSYTLDLDANIQFDGPTTVRGGTFTTFSGSPSDGYVQFRGQTTWDGDVTVIGNAAQLANASVSGPTVIDADVFDMDGGGTSDWSIANNLTINTPNIDPAGFQKVDSALTITGTFLGRLNMNIALPSTQWIMDGELNLGGAGGILVTRVYGTKMLMLGDLNLQTRSGISAPTEFGPGSQTTFQLPTTQLRLTGNSIIDAGAVFLGEGEIQVAPGVSMHLANNANTGSVGLVNEGKLYVGASPGAAFVDRFTNTASAVWSVELGGYIPGTEHDLLFVLAGPAELDGVLDVQMIDAGNGVFVPQVGDSFIILRASRTLNGVFSNSPISYGSGNVYLWSVVYDRSTVSLQLDEIVPCPADLNADGMVDGADLGMLLGAWGPCKDCQADLTNDGMVDGADLGTLLGAWGPCL